MRKIDVGNSTKNWMKDGTQVIGNESEVVNRLSERVKIEGLDKNIIG